MEWPDTLELTLNGIAQGGEGVGRWHDRVVFAAGGLPGERVQVRLREQHVAYARGDVVHVLEASPDRVELRLTRADHMPWQHIAYSAQLLFRRQILIDQLAKIAGLVEAPVEATQPASRPWEYRNSVRFHSDGRQVGYYAPDTRHLHPIDQDPLLLPVLNQALVALRRALLEVPTGPFDVIIRASESDGYALGVLQGVGEELALLAQRWRNHCPPLAGVLVEGGPALGATQLFEDLGGVTFHLRPTTFFQVNSTAAEVLLGLVRAGLDLQGHERVLDLYCGAGAFALPLARSAGEVVGVEEFDGAIEDGRVSVLAGGIANVRMVAGRVERMLAGLAGPFDAVVLDPPRRGCHPQALDALLKLAPRRIVYVSCHPATLARDLKILLAGGYRIERITPVDLFPQTAHIECVSVLTAIE